MANNNTNFCFLIIDPKRLNFISERYKIKRLSDSLSEYTEIQDI